MPIDEKHPLNPQSPYAATKISADKLAESFYRSYGLPVSIMRPFNTFGPRQSLRAVIPTIIAQLLEGSTLVLGSLKPTRDLTFVSDTVNGFIQLALKDSVDGETFNLGTGKEISIQDLVYLIADNMGIHPEIKVDEARIRGNQSEVMQLVSDNSKAHTVFGWKPEYSLKDGLRITKNWLKKTKGLHKSHVYNI